MVSYSTNQFRPGLKVLLDGEPCNIVKSEFFKPGKGQAFTKVKLRNLKTGRIWDRTCKNHETLEAAEVLSTTMEYLYNDGRMWHFMKTDGSYEQHAITPSALGDVRLWLREQDVCEVTLWENEPIEIIPPNFVDLEVVHTEQSIKKAAQSGSKPATLKTGVIIKVPLFVETGDVVRIDTRTREYQGRVKGV